MRIKVLQLGKFYVRIDVTVLHGYNVLLGFNYCEGLYSACKDSDMKDCVVFDYKEQQIGFLFFTVAIGKETYNPSYDEHIKLQ